MRSKHFYRTLVYFLLIIPLISCSNNETQKTLTPFGPSTEESFTTGLGVNSNKAISDKYFTFMIKSTEGFKPEINIINDTPFENKFSLIFLLDYQQIPVLLNNQDKLVVEKKLKPVSEEKIQVELPKLTEGRHDFLVIAVKESEETTPDSIYMYRRGTLIVNNDENVNIDFNTINTENKKDLPEGIIFTSKRVPKTIYDSVSNLSKTDIQNLYLNFKSAVNKEYIILSFLNNHLINDSIQNPYISIKESGNIHLPIKIPNNLQAYNELFFVVIESPSERIEDDNGNLKDIPWDVMFSEKITIN